MDIERALVVERLAGLALVARLEIRSQMLAVYCLGEDSRACGLAHATRTAEQIRMSQSVGLDGILQSRDKRRLPHY